MKSADLSGTYATDWSWSPLFCDVDNDVMERSFYHQRNYIGEQMIWIMFKFLTKNEFFSTENNKNTPDSVLYNKMPLYPNISYIYKNNGDLTFSNKAKEWGIKHQILFQWFSLRRSG